MTSNWIQKWWWKIKGPASIVTFEQQVIKPYLNFQESLSYAQQNADKQSSTESNKMKKASKVYADYARQVIAYDQRPWLGKCWVWLTGKGPDIERKRLWCAVYQCRPLLTQAATRVTKASTFFQHSLTPEKIDVMQKIINPPIEQPALPTSWRDAIKKIIHGWGTFYKSDKLAATTAKSSDRQKPAVSMNTTSPVQTTALIISAIPALAQENPENYKGSVRNFIRACGFYGLDVLQATPRQVSGHIRKSLAVFHTDKAEKVSMGSEGKAVDYTPKAQADYHTYCTEQLTALKSRFNIAGLPLEQVQSPNSFFSIDETWELYQEGQQFRCEQDKSMKKTKAIACLQSEASTLLKEAKERALECAALKVEVFALKVEFEEKLVQTVKEIEARLDQAAKEIEARFKERYAKAISASLKTAPVRVTVVSGVAALSPRLFQTASTQAETIAESRFRSVSPKITA